MGADNHMTTKPRPVASYEEYSASINRDDPHEYPEWAVWVVRHGVGHHTQLKVTAFDKAEAQSKAEIGIMRVLDGIGLLDEETQNYEVRVKRLID